jgi:hypothetical protein
VQRWNLMTGRLVVLTRGVQLALSRTTWSRLLPSKGSFFWEFEIVLILNLATEIHKIVIMICAILPFAELGLRHTVVSVTRLADIGLGASGKCLSLKPNKEDL